MKYKDFWDKFGICLSSICLIHCIFLPLFLVISPHILSHNHEYVENEFFHQLIIILILVGALFAFIPAYKIHKKKLPMVLFLIGLTLIIISSFLDHNVSLSILSSIFIIFAHIKNKDHCKKCSH